MKCRRNTGDLGCVELYTRFDAAMLCFGSATILPSARFSTRLRKALPKTARLGRVLDAGHFVLSLLCKADTGAPHPAHLVLEGQARIAGCMPLPMAGTRERPPRTRPLISAAISGRFRCGARVTCLNGPPRGGDACREHEKMRERKGTHLRKARNRR